MWQTAFECKVQYNRQDIIKKFKWNSQIGPGTIKQGLQKLAMRYATIEFYVHKHSNALLTMSNTNQSCEGQKTFRQYFAAYKTSVQNHKNHHKSLNNIFTSL